MPPANGRRRERLCPALWRLQVMSNAFCGDERLEFIEQPQRPLGKRNESLGQNKGPKKKLQGDGMRPRQCIGDPLSEARHQRSKLVSGQPGVSPDELSENVRPHLSAA